MKKRRTCLAKEVSEICDVNNLIVSKTEVKMAIFKHHYKEMVDFINTISKLDASKGYDFEEVQSYFINKSVANTRMAFRIRSQMLADISRNFKNKYKVKGTVSDGL